MDCSGKTYHQMGRDRRSPSEVSILQSNSTRLVRMFHTVEPPRLTSSASVSKYIINIPTAPTEPESSNPNPTRYGYQKLYESVLQKKKDDRSYRYFRNINRIAKEFPAAHSADEGKKVKVWCSNDYVRCYSCSLTDWTKLITLVVGHGRKPGRSQ